MGAFTTVGHELTFRAHHAKFPSPLSFTNGCVYGLVKIGYVLPKPTLKKTR